MNYLLNVDWLEFRASSNIQLNNFFSGGIYKFSNGLFLESFKDYGYLKLSHPFCFKIYYLDEEIGLLHSKTLDLTLSPGFNTIVKIDNKVLYTQSLESKLKLIVDALGLTKTKIVRLDICYDTDTDVLSRFKTLYYEPSIIFKNRNKLNVGNTGRDDKTIHIGSLKSRVKCISIYNKTIKLNTENKEYIRNVHRKIFGYKNIYRVEIKIMSRTLEIKDIDIMNLGTTTYLETIFNTYFDNLIQFEDLNTKEKIDFITINNTGRKIERIKKQKNQGGGTQVKGIINFLDRESKTKEFRGTIKDWKVIRNVLLKKYELETWDLVRKK